VVGEGRRLNRQGAKAGRSYSQPLLFLGVLGALAVNLFLDNEDERDT